MTGHRIFTPHNSLAGRLNDPRGVDAATATKAADAAVTRYEPEGISEIKRALTMLAKDVAGVRSPDSTATFSLARVYAGADVIAGLSALFDRPRLGEAASSLCKLLTEQKGARPDAIAVHIDAMLMIIKDDALGKVLLPGLLDLHDIQAVAEASETDDAA